MATTRAAKPVTKPVGATRAAAKTSAAKNRRHGPARASATPIGRRQLQQNFLELNGTAPAMSATALTQEIPAFAGTTRDGSSRCSID
jgi:hypothetical protein